jgi:hypothetical protein
MARSPEMKQIPGEDKGLGERALRGGEGFNKLTKRLQLGGAVVLAPILPAASAVLLTGGFFDHAQEDYASSWADTLKKKREARVAEQYGPNKVVIKGKVVDRHAAAYTQTPKSESIGAKFGNEVLVQLGAKERDRKLRANQGVIMSAKAE